MIPQLTRQSTRPLSEVDLRCDLSWQWSGSQHQHSPTVFAYSWGWIHLVHMAWLFTLFTLRLCSIHAYIATTQKLQETLVWRLVQDNMYQPQLLIISLGKTTELWEVSLSRERWVEIVEAGSSHISPEAPEGFPGIPRHLLLTPGQRNHYIEWTHIVRSSHPNVKLSIRDSSKIFTTALIFMWTNYFRQDIWMNICILL